MSEQSKSGLIRADRNRLSDAYPAIFERPNSKNPKKPLKVGIIKDIKARGGIIGTSGHPIGHLRLKAALRDYTSGRRYQQALANGGMRIDLDGNEVEPITQEQIDHAKGKLAAMDEKLAAWKASMAA